MSEPLVDLLLSEESVCSMVVKAGEMAEHTIVESPGVVHGHPKMIGLLLNDEERLSRALEQTGEADVDGYIGLPKSASCVKHLLVAEV